MQPFVSDRSVVFTLSSVPFNTSDCLIEVTAWAGLTTCICIAI
jgi:hypothetical protein